MRLQQVKVWNVSFVAKNYACLPAINSFARSWVNCMAEINAAVNGCCAHPPLASGEVRCKRGSFHVRLMTQTVLT